MSENQKKNERNVFLEVVAAAAALRKSLVEDLSLGRRDLPPPSASGAGGIMRQQACSDHFTVSMSASQLRASPQLHLSVSKPCRLPSLPLFLFLSLIHSFIPRLLS